MLIATIGTQLRTILTSQFRYLILILDCKKGGLSLIQKIIQKKFAKLVDFLWISYGYSFSKAQGFPGFRHFGGWPFSRSPRLTGDLWWIRLFMGRLGWYLAMLKTIKLVVNSWIYTSQLGDIKKLYHMHQTSKYVSMLSWVRGFRNGDLRWNSRELWRKVVFFCRMLGSCYLVGGIPTPL